MCPSGECRLLAILKRVAIAAAILLAFLMGWLVGLLTAQAPIEVTAQFPAKLQFLFKPARYKIAYGGRGGAKSWGFARALLIQGAERPLRILCARENQNSIAESVHQLLEDQIVELKLKSKYRVQKAAIIGPRGTQYAFAGLRHNIDNIKSLESYDIVWIEEANNVSKASWDKLVPTIRKKGSEIWASFNPELEQDETYQRFVVHPPPGAVVVKISWRDNPWFPEVLMDEMEHLKSVDEEDYMHIYEGACKTAVTGAVYGKEMKQAELDGRITTVPYDPIAPVDTVWDIGWDDSTAIWCVQRIAFQWRFIDYIESRHRKFSDYLKMLQDRPYVYRYTYLPHDARAKELGSGKSIEELARAAGLRVKIVKALAVGDRLNAARTIFPLSWFDRQACADGLQALRHYRWPEPSQSGVVPKEPLHDSSSHAADAFGYAALTSEPRALRGETKPAGPPPRPPRVPGAYAPFG